MTDVQITCVVEQLQGRAKIETHANMLYYSILWASRNRHGALVFGPNRIHTTGKQDKHLTKK